MKKCCLLLSLITLCFFLTPAEGSKYKHELSICALFQNEARFLEEWIEFHRLVGVSHFYLYNHGSCDHYEEVLAPYVKQGIVEIIDWNFPAETWEKWMDVQCSAYLHCIHAKAKTNTKWLCLLDTDEFLFSTEQDSLPNFLAEFEGYGGLCVHWQLFGTSGIEKLSQNELLTENMVFKGNQNHPRNHNIKSIVRPDRVKKCYSAHFVVYRKPYFHVNELHNKYPSKNNPSRPTIERIRINHYWARDEHFFITTKIARRTRSMDITDILQMKSELDEIYDDTIHHFLPPLKKCMKIIP